jgi:fluoride exporter
MLNVLGIFLGGGIGAALRYGISRLISERHDAVFPWGTFVVNIAGAFVIGLLFQLFDRIFLTVELRNLITIGLIGAFSTFSIFTMECLVLLRGGHFGTGVLYFFGSGLAGLAAVSLGLFLGDIILRMMRY